MHDTMISVCNGFCIVYERWYPTCSLAPNRTGRGKCGTGSIGVNECPPRVLGILALRALAQAFAAISQVSAFLTKALVTHGAFQDIPYPLSCGCP